MRTCTAPPSRLTSNSATGVYDNLGLETAWKHYTTILVSDGGGHIGVQEDVKSDPVRHTLRVLEIVDNQVRSLRKRQLIDSYRREAGDPEHRAGAYWSIRTDIADYGLADALPCPHDQTTALAAVPTRLGHVDEITQERLINWGYAVCDAGMRAHVDPALAPPADFPYPAVGVG
jgi:NTE family protein